MRQEQDPTRPTRQPMTAEVTAGLKAGYAVLGVEVAASGSVRYMT